MEVIHVIVYMSDQHSQKTHGRAKGKGRVKKRECGHRVEVEELEWNNLNRMRNIILDVDETLVHTLAFPLEGGQSEVVTHWFGGHPNALTAATYMFIIGGVRYYVYARPNLSKFLAYIFAHFDNVGIWSAGTSEYVKRVVKYIFTKDQLAKVKLFYTRRDCTPASDGRWKKPLGKVFGQCLYNFMGFLPSNTILLDNDPIHRSGNFKNMIVAEEFTFMKTYSDDYLARLMKLFDKKLRGGNSPTAGLYELVAAANNH